MRLSKRTEYGLQALVHLGRAGDEKFVQSRDLAMAEGLPGKYVELVLMALRRANLLKSRAGVGGGYRLARSPAHILIADVIAAMERVPDEEDDRGETRTPGKLALEIISDKLEDVVSRTLRGLTLEQLLDQLPRNLTQTTGMYYI